VKPHQKVLVGGKIEDAKIGVDRGDFRKSDKKFHGYKQRNKNKRS